ncbi:MAG: TATA-box-binding protein [Candidatus Korarchaeota archaeon]|nr:TATA-box-binding protein [Candidatus Korarchaeota archaeon]NIU85294.1 TATA-box-binding protein [Candidatus Thorarchaeota archaeon]NIW15393.1 TATA-box-binding protein [Candidatus Thorarchaeota archaeon]NIW53338.1 TATA-box-binding protein [Candidatus Korarchaeota archaeon]
MEKIEYRVENVVGSMDINVPLDLRETYKRLLKLQSEVKDELSRKEGDGVTDWPFLVRYEPKKFPGIILKVRYNVRASSLIFNSGKLVITGAKNEDVLNKAGRVIVALLKRCDIKIEKTSPVEVHNIVASASLNEIVNLEKVATRGRYNVFYEPEIFPGLIYKMREPKVTLLVFKSGKVVCTGAKSRDDISQALDKIDLTIQEYDAYVPEDELPTF